MLRYLIDFLKKSDVEYYENFDISQTSYIGIGGSVKLFVKPQSAEILIRTVNILYSESIPYKIVGAMSNILPVDGFYDGVILSTRKIKSYSLAETTVTIDTGARLSRVISEISRLGFGGMESLYGIPGSVGGMIYGNAGAYGREISDFFISALLYDPQKRFIYTQTAFDMEFSYRKSALKQNGCILLSTTLALKKANSEKISSELIATLSKRKSTQPFGEKSLGSIFKRSGDIPVSKLIDELGLKGYSVGGAEISKKHAGFIINRNNASARDVKELIAYIKSKLKIAYGIDAEEEIEFLQ